LFDSSIQFLTTYVIYDRYWPIALQVEEAMKKEVMENPIGVSVMKLVNLASKTSWMQDRWRRQERPQTRSFGAYSIQFDCKESIRS